MDFKDLVGLAQRRWKSIVTLFALAIAVAAAVSFTATPIYQSTARVYIATDTTNVGEAFYANAFLTARVESYADLVTSGEVMEAVIDRLDLDLTPEELAAKTTATVDEGTVIIRIEARDPDPGMAQQIARAESQAMVDYLDKVETPEGQTTAPVKASVINKAVIDEDPVSPRTSLNLALAGLLGLLLGITLAVARDLLDTTVKTIEDVESVTESAVLAHVAFDPEMKQSPLLTDVGSHAPRAEAFRLLRTNLQFLDLDNSPKSFVVTSAISGEGKTTTSTNLAIALAQADNRVILVDGDLRRPKVAELLSLEGRVGLVTALMGKASLADSIQRHAASGVDVLTSGPLPPNPTEILQSQVARELLERLRDVYDIVIIDAPPLLPVADAALLAADVDGALLVVQHGETTAEQLRHAVTRLEQVGARLFGTVVNMSPQPKRWSGYSYGYAPYGYDPVEDDKAKPGWRKVSSKS